MFQLAWLDLAGTATSTYLKMSFEDYLSWQVVAIQEHAFIEVGKCQLAIEAQGSFGSSELGRQVEKRSVLKLFVNCLRNYKEATVLFWNWNTH